ncbi:MAG: hypothetical protein L0Z73_03700 [Gammaproteobacteria bacterium]|nr:hypothetical protein [Gammaproteobacteria bacterium]
MNNSETRNVATYLLAVSILSLALAIIYFTIEVRNVSKQIPAVLTAVETTSKEIEPAIKHVGEIKDMIAPVLEEWTQTRKQIPLILDEVAKIREQVPPILKEVEATRQHIPGIVDATNNAATAVTKAAKEIEATRPLVPQILNEVEKTRKFIPAQLDRAERMIADARAAGQQASEGAVTGVITGIFKAPFKLVGNIGKKLGLSGEEMRGLTEEDLQIMHEASKFLATARVDDAQAWKNPATGANGTITLLNIFQKDGKECRKGGFEIWKQGKTRVAKEVSFCQDSQGVWEPIE